MNSRPSPPHPEVVLGYAVSSAEPSYPYAYASSASQHHHQSRSHSPPPPTRTFDEDNENENSNDDDDEEEEEEEEERTEDYHSDSDNNDSDNDNEEDELDEKVYTARLGSSGSDASGVTSPFHVPVSHSHPHHPVHHRGPASHHRLPPAPRHPPPLPPNSPISIARHPRSPMSHNELPSSIRLVSGRPSRHRSQGFFEPSLPTASYSDNKSSLSASRIAAQTAMQHQQHQPQAPSPTSTAPPPKRFPQGGPPPSSRPSEDTMRTRRRGSSSPSPTRQPTPAIGNQISSPVQQAHPNNIGFPGGHTQAATTAANVAFPRNHGLQKSPSMPMESLQYQQHQLLQQHQNRRQQPQPQPHPHTQPQAQPQAQSQPQQHQHHEISEREQKSKSEKSKKKLFSKSRHMGMGREKDLVAKDKPSPAPNKMGAGLSRIVTSSSTSLAEPTPNSPSIYNLPNSSTSTILHPDRPPPLPPLPAPEKDKDKEKAHKHHFLSRQKLNLKLKGDDHYNLPLSSAASNSRPSDPNAPQSLYSFTSSSPIPAATTFGRSVTGLDLLHGLRDRKKEDKTMVDSDQVEWLANSGGNTGAPSALYGPPSLGNTGGSFGEAALRETLQGFGLSNMAPEDAWDFLQAKLLVIFDGEDVRIAIEDLNKLVSIHIQRCVQRRAPNTIMEDVRELLVTGFSSIDHALNGVPEDRLVPHLVQVWLLVLGTILPFIQVVFLPLDLEFKGCGPVMNIRDAKEFWNGLQDPKLPLDVRSIVLIAFRDTVILSRYEALRGTFSRLSLDSLQSSIYSSGMLSKSTGNVSNSSAGGGSGSGRPGTAASLDAGGGGISSSSYGSSQSPPYFNNGNNHIGSAAAGSFSSDSLSDSRSRAASNTSSNPDHQVIFHPFSSSSSSTIGGGQSHHQRPTTATTTTTTRGTNQLSDLSQLISETVGRMLQCVNILAGVQTDDKPQEQIELLSKALKQNWLGRARTGRDRRGFIGAKSRDPTTTTIPTGGTGSPRPDTATASLPSPPSLSSNSRKDTDVNSERPSTGRSKEGMTNTNGVERGLSSVQDGIRGEIGVS